ncbi:MAG: SLBB domain-containing protein [Candidatus Neomarinimicrobiota bacterium]|nr:SLBB domain-containing protein [Candidatus Neomarinimicrobiota bacterium]
MNLKRFLLSVTLIFLVMNFGVSQFNYSPTKVNTQIQLTGEDYITGEDGVPRMNINIWGHVKYPGTYLVYDGIDLLTCLSMAGGPLKGAKLSKISISSKDGKNKTINLNKLNNQSKLAEIELNPYDTIKIDEKFSHILLTKTSIIAVLLQLTNVILTATSD